MEFKKTYNDLLSSNSSQDKDVLLAKINTFLARFPQSLPVEEQPTKTFTDYSLKFIYKNTLKTMIDIIEDVSSAITNSQYTDSASTRRAIAHSFLREERRFYVGLTIIFLSAIVYFIDSAA